ncbi:unnamed protein product [Sphagnum jensenii]|uniref:Uncharacterized protein n=1 Tax=Sphagnum jensenii TaxID=128206 RepID=A0ABP0WIE1_9BRYO
MEICSASADSQTTGLDEFVLVSRRTRKAGRGAHASSPTVRKCSPAANGSLDFASPELCAAPAKLISPTLGEEIGKEGGNAGSDQATSVASQDRSRLQQQGKEAKALQPRSYGGPRGEPPQRSSTVIAPLDVASKPRESETEGAGGSHTHQVPPKGDPSHPSKSEVYSISVGPGRSSEGSDIAAARQSERIDLSAARAKALRVRNSLRKNSTSSVITPLPHSLIVQPGSGTGAASPKGEAAQGPSPIDYSMEIKADFPTDLVIVMQESVTKKARRTVIGRMLGGRATFKALLDCLKLHLPAPFNSVSLLTRGYFEVLFENEEGAKATRRLSASLLASPQAARKKKRYIKLDLLALAPQDLASSLQNEYDGLGSIGSPAAQGQQGNA